MREELKRYLQSLLEANDDVKANSLVLFILLVKELFSDEKLTNESLAKLCNIDRKTIYRNKASIEALLCAVPKTVYPNGDAVPKTVYPNGDTVPKTVYPNGDTNEEKEKTENENLPCTPLKEENKEKEKSIPPTPQGDGRTDGKPDFVTSGADLVNCEANRCERAPRRQKVVLPDGDNDTTPSEDNAMPDHEHYLAFIKAYPPQKAYSFRVKYINKFNKAWRDAIARGYKGKDLVAALEMAKESKKWKETYCDYAPNAIDFLEQNFAALYYPSCKPSKTAAATTVIRADIDI